MSHEIILETLKFILKKKKISYKVLAIEIGMSESGLKKLLTANDISINRLTQITTFLGINLADLMNLAQEEEIKDIKLTEKQEKALLENETLLRVLWRFCVENKSEEEVLKLEGLTAKKLNSSLLKLENLDLIKITSYGKIVSVHGELYRWVGGSRLLKKLNQNWSKKVLNESLKDKQKDELGHRLSYFQLERKTKIEFINKLNDLVDEYARYSKLEKLKYPKNQLEDTSFLYSMVSKSLLD